MAQVPQFETQVNGQTIGYVVDSAKAEKLAQLYKESCPGDTVTILDRVTGDVAVFYYCPQCDSVDHDTDDYCRNGADVEESSASYRAGYDYACGIFD